MEGPRVGDLPGRQTADSQRVIRSGRNSPAALKRPGCIYCNSKDDQADLNRRPPDSQSGDASFKSTKPRSRRCSSSPKNERGEVVDGSVLSRAESLPIKADSFSAALAMIASLPLSDAEKADAVRRLMVEQVAAQGQQAATRGEAVSR